MAQIKCPKCGEIIELGKDQYNALLSEIGNEEIEKRVSSQPDALSECENTHPAHTGRQGFPDA